MLPVFTDCTKTPHILKRTRSLSSPDLKTRVSREQAVPIKAGTVAAGLKLLAGFRRVSVEQG